MGFSLSENNGVGSASYMPPALGALMNTVQRTSNGFGVNLAGIASFGHSSSNTNNIQTSSVGFKVNIPITSLLTISLGYSRTRYFTDETTSSSYCGSLNYLGDKYRSGFFAGGELFCL